MPVTYENSERWTCGRATLQRWGRGGVACSPAQQIARPNLCVVNYAQGFVRDLLACEASPHAPSAAPWARSTRAPGLASPGGRRLVRTASVAAAPPGAV